MICTCDQCDSAFCGLQLTALIKPKWCVLLCCCACLHPNTILMEAGWTTFPCPATNLSIFIFKSSARTKQSVIIVALKTRLETKLGICIYKSLLLHRPDDNTGFTPSCPPHFTTKLRPCNHLYLSYTTATQLNPNNPRSSEEKPIKPERHWKHRSGSRTPGLAPVAKSLWKHKKWKRNL